MDRQTFDRLMLESLPAALRFAVRLSGDPAAAEDLVHDALVRAAQAWRTFRGDSVFRTWFFQIVLNAWRDHLRQTHSAQDLEQDMLDIHAPNPAHRLAEAELGAVVAKHVSKLPPRQREVLVLVIYEHLTPSQAATVLGITEQNARVNLYHARERLKKMLAPYLGEPQREATSRSIKSD